MHRSSAREFLISLHNMLLQMLGVGLMYFVVSAAMGARNPLSWPSLGVSLDEGSDGLCAINFAERKLGANVNPHWDDAHGIKNDLNLMMQSVGLWTHTLLMLAARRAFHGPWAEDRYFSTVSDSLQSLVHHLLPGECPLLGHLTPRILWDHGDMHLLGDVGVDEYVLNLVKGSRSLLAKGWKPSLARYLDVVKAAREEDTEWHTKLYGVLLALFMTGVLSPTTFGVAFAS